MLGEDLRARKGVQITTLEARAEGRIERESGEGRCEGETVREARSEVRKARTDWSADSDDSEVTVRRDKVGRVLLVANHELVAIRRDDMRAVLEVLRETRSAPFAPPDENAAPSHDSPASC